MRRIVILGANGYIGRHLAHKFSGEGQNEVFLFDIQENVEARSNYLQLNINSILTDEVKQHLFKADYIFFFAGLTGTFKSVEKYQDFININELGLLNLLDLIKDRSKKPKIIFPSTRLVYKGEKDIALNEKAAKEFKTIYGVNKFACENYLQIYKNLFQIDYTVFRICVPYGNMLSNELSYGTLSHFFNKAVNGHNITLYGDGSLKRTFTHIDDLTELLIQGAFNDHTSGEIYNIGGADDLSLLEVANSIAKIYNVEVEFDEFPEIDAAIESGDTIFDGSKLQQLLGYKYQYSFSSWVNSFNK